MSIENINITGINLHSNIADSSNGNCEELINVKSENGQLKIDTDYEVISADIPYADIITHIVGTETMYIGKDSEGVVWFDPETGNIFKRLHQSAHVDMIYLATTSNLLTISDKHSINTIVYAWKEGAYKLLFDGSLGLDILVTISQTPVEDEQFLPLQYSDEGIDKPSLINNLKSFLHKYESENVNVVEGAFIMGFTITLYDNNEVGPFNLQYVPINHDDSIFNDNGFYSQPLNIVANLFLSKAYQKVQLQIYRSGDMEKYRDLIKSINLYVSQPISSFDLTENGVTAVFNKDGVIEDGKNFHLTIAEKSIQNREIGRQLLFLNKSWDLSEFIESSEIQFIDYNIIFGGDSQTTERTMPVTTSHISRAGKMLTYNSRIHYYNSIVRLNLAQPNVFVNQVSDDYINANVYLYVHLKIDTKEIIQKFYTSAKIKNSTTSPEILLPEFILVQDSRASKITIEYNGSIKEISLSPSPAYDYSYAYGVQHNGLMSSGDAPIETDNTYSEHDVISVSAQNNPMYFPISNSYRTQGNVLNLGYAIEPISNVEIGTYPLYIFTDRGIFTISQGVGNVLYGEIKAINTDIAYTVALTRTGVVYIANNGVYILNGMQSIKLSLPIEGRIDTSIRQSPAYTECCMNDKLYDVSRLISLCEFKDYLRGATLVYTPAADEVILTNGNYLYSYVFSFIFKQWRKIDGIYNALSGNTICRAVLQNSSAAQTAKGQITVASAVIIEEHTFSSKAHAQFTGNFISRAGERYALIISGVQTSASLFIYPTSLAIIMSTLTRDIEYMDDYYSNGILNIYYGLDYEQGLVIRLVNLTTGADVINVTLDEHIAAVTIPDKGIGETITINGVTGRNITSEDSVLTIVDIISEVINSNTGAWGMNANSSNNVVDVFANAPGVAGNDLELEVTAGNYVSLVVEALSGGKDVTLEPGDYVQIIDRSRPVDTNKTIHIQTRPITFTDIYTSISRTILYCRSILSQANNLSVYIFASNNLQNWQCVAASQKSGISIDHIRTSRVAKSYKYYTVIIGGVVYSNTELDNIAIDLKAKFNKKLR